MAKITPKFRTVLLFIFLTGSYITANANFSSLFQNFLNFEYADDYNTIKSNPIYSKSSKVHSPFVFSIEKKIFQVFGLYNLYTSIKKSVYEKSLRNYPLLNSIGQPSIKLAGHAISLDSKTNVSCNGGNDGAITITVSGETGPYTYLWSGNGRNDTSEDISNLLAGTYTVTVSDSDSSVNSTFSVSEPLILTAQVIKSDVTCNGANDGTISITNPQGGYGTFQYSINNGTNWQDSGEFFGLGNANYQVVIRDKANINCTITLNSNLIITQPPILNATVTSTNVTCNGSGNGTISITNPQGGYGIFQYSIDNGGNWQDSGEFSGLGNASYQVVIRDKENIDCSVTLNSNLTITQPPVLNATVTSTNVTCNGANDGTISVTNPQGGYGTYEFSINNGNSWQTSGNFSNLGNANYQVFIQDKANTSCTITLNSNLEITQPPVLNATVTSTNVTCNGANDGTISVTNPQGGYGTYEFSINNGNSWQASGNFSNLGNANYQVVIQDKANTSCTITLNSNLEITQPPVLNATVTSTNVTCNGANDGTISVTNPQGGYGTYEFSINNGNSWQTSGNFSNLGNANYQVVIRDKANTNCTITLNSNLTITQPFPLLADIAYSNVSCNGANDGSIIMTSPSGGYGTYEYSIGGIDWQSSGSFLNLPNNTYSVQIRDKAHPGCAIILDSTLEIIQPEILTASLVSQDNVNCKGFATGAATINASEGTAPYTYSWGAFGTGATKTDLSAGTYSVIVTDANGCKTQPLEVVITEPNNFIEIVNITPTSGCYLQNNGTATAEVQGGTGSYSYLWSDGQTTQTATGFAPGNYSVTVKDQYFCETQKSVTITAPANLIITGFHTTETTYFGSETGTSTVLISGGTANYTFLWSNGQTGQTARNLAAGTYSVTVTDANGCKKTGSTEIFDAIAADIVGSSQCEDKKSEIRIAKYSAINVRGGSGTYTYSWDFGANAIPATATGPGEHIVEYTQIGQKTVKLTITSTSPITGEKQTFQTTYEQYVAICFSTCSSQDLSVGDIYIGNQAGVKITDADCLSNPNPAGTAIWAETPFNADRYTLYMEYIFYITHSNGSVTTVEGIYCDPDHSTPIGVKRKIVDINFSCSDAISVEKFYMAVNQQKDRECLDGAQPKCYSTGGAQLVTAPFYASAIATELLCNGNSDGSIRVRATGGIAPYQYRLTKDGVPNQAVINQPNLFEGLAAGTYTIEVKDNAATPKTFSFTREIIQPTNPLMLKEISRTDVTCFGGSNGSATVEGSGGTPKTSGTPYVYVWENGQTTAIIGNLPAGIYPVRIIDANGCEASTVITITQPAKILADAGPDQILLCGNNSANLQAVYDVSNPELGEWSIINGPTGASIDDIHNPQAFFTGVQGTYTLRWTVPCGASDDVKITINNCSTIDFDGINDHIDFGDNFNPSDNFTFEAWVKQNTNATAGIKTILSKRDLSNLDTGFDLIIEDGTPKFRWNNSEITASNAIGKDRWYHLAVISNNSGTKLYVDGINVGSATTVEAPVSNTFKFLTGAMYDSGTALNPKNYFHGWIEEVRIWNTALTEEQLRFMMNQRIKANGSNVHGVEIPLDVPGNLAWNSLKGYYQMEKVANGFTIGETASAIKGKLINIVTTQERTAPLPYISAKAGLWFDDSTWLRPQVWDAPNSTGINSDTINWNIARIFHNINSGGRDITVLGLLSKSAKLTIAKPGEALDEKNPGQSLTITHYLELNGNIDLVGESQLIQTDSSTPGQTIISVLEESSTGFIERDQQGTANSYNYNYWSSPVSLQESTNNSGYTIGSIMLDGTNTANPLGLSFGGWHEYADGAYSTPRKISNYWLYKFRGTSNVYSEWKHVGSTGPLKAGEGYTMKGTSGGAEISDPQNYVFKGKPNNGNITLSIGKDQNYLLGNPYPSALDATQFIKDNLKDGGNNTVGNVFNGALYFWDHFAGKTHILAEYIGGYATRNLLDAVPAVSNDERINANDDEGTKIPGQFIPVGQGFFINTVLDPMLSSTITVDGGNLIFKNSQRAFVKETDPEDSQFLRPEKPVKENKQAETRSKIRLDFKSPMGYNRQILVGADPNATNGFDLGYDAPLNDNNPEDMFWLIDNIEFVIQGVPNFGIDQVLPLGIKIKEAGVFLIKINKLENVSEDVNIYLKNLQDSTYFDLRKGDYSLKLDPGYYNKHFQIVFQDEKVSTDEPDYDEETEEEEEQEADGTTGEEENLDGEIKVFYVSNNRELAVLNPSKLEIERIVIYDMTGKVIQEFKNVSNEKDVRLPVREFPAAVYAIKLYSGNKEISKSIILIR